MNNPSASKRMALVATLHCLSGCALGEILGLAIGLALGWSTTATVMLAIVLAFVFGYSFTAFPLIRQGVKARKAFGIALASDSISITVMEIVDNLIVLAIPGAMAAGLDDMLFWSSLVLGLAIAFVIAFPVNLWLLRRGQGHAIAHAHHHS